MLSSVASPVPSDHPRYVEIARRIEARRPTLTQPLKLPPEHQLASEYRIARDTLRRALGLLERNGAVTRQRGRGRGTYLRPLRIRPTSAKGNTIGFVRPWWCRVQDEWFSSLVFDGISHWSDEHDCRLSIVHVDRFEDDEAKLLEKLSARDLAGVVWVQPVPEQRRLLSVISREVPCVVVGREYEDVGLHAVLPDYRQAAMLLDSFLVERGHLFYSVVGRSPADPYGASWLNAFRDAYARRGSYFDDHSYYLNITPFAREHMPQMVMDFHLAMQSASRAVILTSSSHVVPLVASKRFRDAVPGKISVATFDYGIQPASTYWPGRTITHVTCDWRAIGTKAIEVLFSLIEGDDAPQVTYEPVSLVEGQTVQDYSASEPLSPGTDATGPVGPVSNDGSPATT